MAKDLMRQFRDKYSITYTNTNGVKLDPNIISQKLVKEQTVEFANTLEDTPNERLIAFRDPAFRKLINFFMSAILYEHKRMTPIESFFDIRIDDRYKSVESATKKINKKDIICDFMGFKIIPEKEPEIFYSKDPIVQEMIDRRESTRDFIKATFKTLAKTEEMSFIEYCKHCDEVLDKLKEIFVDKTLDNDNDFAVERIAKYDEAKRKLSKELLDYLETNGIDLGIPPEKGNDEKEKQEIPSLENIIAMLEGSPESSELENLTQSEISLISKTNFKKLLIELRDNMSNEVILYQLKSNLMNVFKNSSLLSTLRCFR